MTDKDLQRLNTISENLANIYWDIRCEADLTPKMKKHLSKMITQLNKLYAFIVTQCNK